MPWADHGRKSLFRPGISIIHNSTNRIKRHVPPLAGLVPLEVRRVALPDMEKPVMEKLIHTLATSFLLIALMIGAVYAQTWTSTSGPLRPPRRQRPLVGSLFGTNALRCGCRDPQGFNERGNHMEYHRHADHEPARRRGATEQSNEGAGRPVGAIGEFDGRRDKLECRCNL